MRIASFGSLNIDLTIRVAALPVPGETCHGEGLAVGLGGKGANQAVAAARLGGDAVMIGCVGDDHFGAEALHLLAGHGLDGGGIRRVAGAATGVALIHIDRAGQNSITVAAGANACLSEADFAKAGGDRCILLLQGETPLAASLAVARRVRAAGGMVILDPAPPLPLAELAPLLALCDLVLPNEREAQALAGLRVHDAASAMAAFAVLAGAGVARAIIKAGAAGAWLCEKGTCRHVPAVPVTARDTVAAGDCFAGALAVALAEGGDLAESARFASAAATLSVTRAGAAAAMPGRAEVAAFLAG